MKINIFKKNTKSTYLFSRRLGVHIRKSLKKYQINECSIEIFFEEIKNTKTLSVNIKSQSHKISERILYSSDNFWTCVQEVTKKFDKILSLKQERVISARRKTPSPYKEIEAIEAANELGEIAFKKQSPIFVDIDNESINADDILKYEEAKKELRKIAS